MGSGREFDRVRASACACVFVCMCAMQIRVSSCSKQRCKVCRCPHAMRISFSLSRFDYTAVSCARVHGAESCNNTFATRMETAVEAME